MKAKSTILAAAVATLLSAGMSGQASASIYARSYLAIDNLTLRISDNGGTDPGGATVNNFTFNLANTAFLNGSPAIAGAACSGTPGAPSPTTNDCNSQPNTGLPTAGTVLDAAAANAAGGLPVRVNNDFTFFGPGANQYSNSDSVIYTAQLTGGVPTSTEQIAESELQGGTSASASAEIQSLTGFTFAFTVAGADQIDIAFKADSSRLVQINDLLAATASAQANMDVEFKLESTTGDVYIWRPDGVVGTGFFGSFGVGSESADDFDLNANFGVSTTPLSCLGAPAPGACPSAGSTSVGDDYAFRLTGLTDGEWTLTLQAVTSTSLSRRVPVPEPASLALVGVALAGLGLASRRRRPA